MNKKEYMKIYREKNKEEIKSWKKEYDKNYYQKNKEKIDEKNNIYRKKNKNKLNLYMKKYREKNKEKTSCQKKAQKKIIIPPKTLCENCKMKLAKHRHHPDYTQPLKVIFLCVKCHREEHNGRQ